MKAPIVILLCIVLVQSVVLFNTGADNKRLELSLETEKQRTAMIKDIYGQGCKQAILETIERTCGSVYLPEPIR